jgi:hypothetical protein
LPAQNAVNIVLALDRYRAGGHRHVVSGDPTPTRN